MSRRLPKSASLYVPREMVTSRAFMALTGRAPQVLMVFLSKRRVEKLKRPGPRGERWRTTNNGQIVFTYREALRDYGLTARVFGRAIDNLVWAGFLDIARSGGGLEGDCTLYALSDRWRAYGTSAFRRAERPKGRPWALRAAHKKGRAPAHKKGRAPDDTAHKKGRGSSRNRPLNRAQKGAHSKELPVRKDRTNRTNRILGR